MSADRMPGLSGLASGAFGLQDRFVAIGPARVRKRLMIVLLRIAAQHPRVIRENLKSAA